MKDNMRKEIVTILAFSLLLVACDRELPDNKSGKEVTVRVRLMGITEGGKEDLTRSDSMKEPERHVTSIGDNMLLEMQMERDTSALRANKTQLATTSIFRVIAFKHGTKTFISYGDFTIADGPVGGSLHVPINDSYDFVCYSYNTSTSLDALTYNQDTNIPDTETIPALQGTNDLLWVKIKKDVAEVAPELEILLNRVTVRVKLAVDLSYNKWIITSIGNIMMPYAGGRIRLTSGAVGGRTETSTFSSWTGSGYQWESTTELLVLSIGTTPVTIPIGAIGRQDLSAIPDKETNIFFTTELKPGYSYRLCVQLRMPIFARSNIYWDDEGKKLTFVPATEPPALNNNSKRGYQGVFFRWGSLVGVSPAQKNGNTDSEKNAFDGTVPIYVPIVKSPFSASTWKTTTGSAMAANTTDFPSVTSNWNTWTETSDDDAAPATDIPYMDSRYMEWGDVMDAELNDLATYQGFRGDICQYLCKTGVVSGDYRLPIYYEIGSNQGVWENNTQGWVKGGTFGTEATLIGSLNVDGTTDILTGSTPNNRGYAKNVKMGDVVFPASGLRDTSGGTLLIVGETGCYWSGSTREATDSRSMNFTGIHFHAITDHSRSCALPVRCVKKVDPNGSY
jgi:hypothetical protein